MNQSISQLVKESMNEYCKWMGEWPMNVNKWMNSVNEWMNDRWMNDQLM